MMNDRLVGKLIATDIELSDALLPIDVCRDHGKISFGGCPGRTVGCWPPEFIVNTREFRIESPNAEMFTFVYTIRGHNVAHPLKTSAFCSLEKRSLCSNGKKIVYNSDVFRP